MEKENTFPAGLYVYKPHEKAPDFVIADLVIADAAALVAWLKDGNLTDKDGKQTARFQILEKKDKSGYYVKLNDWKREVKGADVPAL